VRLGTRNQPATSVAGMAQISAFAQNDINACIVGDGALALSNRNSV
jgi:hypothetical protein